MNYVKKLEVIDRKVARLEFDWAIEQRPLWKTLESLSPELSVRWVDRFSALESLSAEWALCMAYESAFDINPPERALWIRAIQCELQRILWCCDKFAKIFRISENGFREQIFWAAVSTLMGAQETITGGRVLPQSFRIGGVAKDMSVGDLNKVQKICDEVESRVNAGMADLEEDRFFISWLERGLVLDGEALSLDEITGPLLQASGGEVDVRKDQPYGPYGLLNIQCFSPSKDRALQGRSIDRFRSMRFQIFQSLQLIRTMLKQIPKGPYRSDREVPSELPAQGSWRSLVEAPSGAMSAEIQKGQIRLQTTSMALAPKLAGLLKNIYTDDFEISLASLGIDFSQGALVEESI